MVHLPRNKKAKNSFIKLEYKVSLSLLSLSLRKHERKRVKSEERCKGKKKIVSLLKRMEICWDKIDYDKKNPKPVTTVPLLIIFSLIIEALT